MVIGLTEVKFSSSGSGGGWRQQRGILFLQMSSVFAENTGTQGADKTKLSFKAASWSPETQYLRPPLR